MATDCIKCGAKVTDATVFMALHNKCNAYRIKCESCGQRGHAKNSNVACPNYRR